jgi:hypothetical protein
MQQTLFSSHFVKILLILFLENGLRITSTEVKLPNTIFTQLNWNGKVFRAAERNFPYLHINEDVLMYFCLPSSPDTYRSAGTMIAPASNADACSDG